MLRAVLLTLAIVVMVGCGGGHSAASGNAAAKLAPWKGGTSTSIRWTDTQPITGGGQLIYHATNIRLGGDRFAITASVTNRSRQRIAIHTLSPELVRSYEVRPPSFGVAYREAPNPNITTRRLIPALATAFVPPLPQVLDPGQTWKGTFLGRSATLREHHTWWIVYGEFFPGGYWVSDKSFSN